MPATGKQRYCRVSTPLGDMVAVAAAGACGERLPDGLRALFFGDPGEDPSTEHLGSPAEVGADPLLRSVELQLDEFFTGARTEFSVPLLPLGSDFEQRVWRSVCHIPYGETASYGAVAAEMGNPGLARAVARALAHSPISIIVPCHRVVRADGGLSGRHRDVDRRRSMIALEAETLHGLR